LSLVQLISSIEFDWFGNQTHTKFGGRLGSIAELKALLHETIFLATCNATNVALQVARKNSRVTPHCARKEEERPSTFRNVARQVACV